MFTNFEFGNTACLKLFLDEDMHIKHQQDRMTSYKFHSDLGRYQVAPEWDKENLNRQIMSTSLFSEPVKGN